MSTAASVYIWHTYECSSTQRLLALNNVDMLINNKKPSVVINNIEHKKYIRSRAPVRGKKPGYKAIETPE